MSSEDTTDNAAAAANSSDVAANSSDVTAKSCDVATNMENWVQFEEEADSKKATCNAERKAGNGSSAPAVIKPESVTVQVEKIGKGLDPPDINDKKTNEYRGAVIATESVQINLDRSGLSRSMTSDSTPDSLKLPSDVRTPDAVKSASLKTIDLRDVSNGRNAPSNVISTSIGNIRQGFANGDTIVTLLPVNTKWPWITPAKFRPELVPEELMAQGLTLTVEDYVHIMELLVNDVRFNMYNICYKRILVLWIFTAFIVLLGLLFSGVTGLTLFGLGVMWLILNAAAIFFCMFIKIKLNHNLEKCMAQVNKHLLRHKILLGLDDRGKISCHKVNLCFIYFDTTDCVKKLQEVIEREEREGRVIGGDDASDLSRQRELQQRMDIDDGDIVIQGSTTTRISRKQERAELLLLRYASRWARHFVRRRLDLVIDSQERDRGVMGLSVPPRHCVSARCPCQFIEDHLKHKPRGYPPGFTWCAYLSEPANRFDMVPSLSH
ncbi:PREDICTED: transmembrane protein C9orf91 homolog isoform X1 [Wasmannia auropunctata]|uniref:transmembrane protein C9orf91 homolog isoform X1 n=1 Tax=Wasmannia auropunctata TaxID=64793 RepID=UPI0005F0AF39|nr:PREDICTED: transmembrane protein C9orf91 homolog isoform X1 [Wasmannia auropunctata]XP_011692244.1 PREDICTED: transmembrane protein C9orf91 homolog isoform X1 [Wasmannia auropunctata]XP_011692245.1 PREDICTED: transmembrane protein C9orf91 homolog isoform X1 [Wasmannia auropunctata]